MSILFFRKICVTMLEIILKGSAQMEKLIVLGTGNAQATHCYNTCFALTAGEEYFLVDAGGGNGILASLEKSHIPLDQIHHIFVSHAHSDHILGMVWMIRMIATRMNQGSYQGMLHIYCHEELVQTIKTLTTLTVGKKFTRHFDERILFHIVHDGETKSILKHTFTFFDIRSTKEKQFGFSLTTEEGIKIAFPGDEPCRDYLFPYVEGSDWLLHEAFCLYSQRDIFKPYEKHHSTVKDVCELAQRLQIPHLVLWHTEDRSLSSRKAAYTEEGMAYYHGDLLVPEDQEIIRLTKYYCE